MNGSAAGSKERGQQSNGKSITHYDEGNSAISAQNILPHPVTQFEPSTDSIRAVLTEKMSKLVRLDEQREGEECRSRR
ncbi:MAG: hypothetical protein GY821_09520 [Gammaproteobacteria bacterium]|nr:hypothetical protein [Gammaproteobacteria bacterium]